MILSSMLRRICLSGLVLVPAAALAKVTPEAARQLGGPTLTAFGAEKAGNADGSIPPYTGPLAAPPPGIDGNPASGLLPDPFPNDRVLYKVDASNLDRYVSLVTAGTAAILRKYPTFHLNVYQSRRTAGYPQWVLDNTAKNATTAELTGNIEGDGIVGAYGGIPFPIPKDGYEVLWNFLVAWPGISNESLNGGGYLIDSSGNVSLDGRTTEFIRYPYYDPTRTSAEGGLFYALIADDTAPAWEDGQKDLIKIPLNYTENDEITYTYTVGQRRVRLAPEFKYDTPISTNGGAFTYDEINLFFGRPDRFHFRLVGKKEILIPYNNFKFNQPDVSVSQWLTPHHPNPELLRWEKHRVWVLDATLKPGQRHIYSRRTFYIDEDTWQMVASDAYDQAGDLYRVAFTMPWPAYNAPYPVTHNANNVYFNLGRGSYAVGEWFGGPNQGRATYYEKELSPSLFSPEHMASAGIR